MPARWSPGDMIQRRGHKTNRNRKQLQQQPEQSWKWCDIIEWKSDYMSSSILGVSRIYPFKKNIHLINWEIEISTNTKTTFNGRYIVSPVLVCYGCSKKYHKLSDLIEIYCPTDLEAGSKKSRCQQDWPHLSLWEENLSQAPSLPCRWVSSPCASSYHLLSMHISASQFPLLIRTPVVWN